MRSFGISLHSRKRPSPNHTGPSAQRSPFASRSTAALKGGLIFSNRGSNVRTAGSGKRAAGSHPPAGIASSDRIAEPRPPARRPRGRRRAGVRLLDRLFAAQRLDLFAAEPEQLAIDLLGMGAEQRGGRDRHLRARHLDRPARHLEIAAHRMLDGDEDLAAIEIGIVEQFHRVHDRAGGDAVVAEPLHDLELGVVLGPFGDHGVDLMAVLEALLRAVEARIADQILASDDLEEPLPVLGIGPGSVDVAVVVRTAALARIDLGGRVRAHDALVAHARRGMAPQILGGIGDAAVIDDAFLHRHLDVLALAGELPLIERGQDADRAMQPGAGVADRQTGLDRPAVGLAGDRHRPAGRLRDHVEGEIVPVRPVIAEALDLGIDDPGIDLSDLVVAEAEPLDDPGREIFDKDVGLLDQPADQRAPLFMLLIGGHAALVRVQQHEIVRIDALFVGRGAAALLALGRLLDLDHIGPEPGQRLRAGGAGLELREIDDAHAVERALLHELCGCGSVDRMGRHIIWHLCPSWVSSPVAAPAGRLLSPLRQRAAALGSKCRTVGLLYRGVNGFAPPYQPPSTPIAWPVTKAAASEARKAMTAATSSGLPKRPTGIALARSAKPRSTSSPYSRRLVLIAREVRIGPGQTALTVIPNGARSSASDFVKPIMAAFEAA